jgi:hypothetical protein
LRQVPSRGSCVSHDGLPELAYPFHDCDILVTACGRLCLHRKRINISSVGNMRRLSAHALQRAALIRYLRRHIKIFNRDGLKESACGSYEVVREHVDKAVPPPS